MYISTSPPPPNFMHQYESMECLLVFDSKGVVLVQMRISHSLGASGDWRVTDTSLGRSIFISHMKYNPAARLVHNPEIMGTGLSCLTCSKPTHLTYYCENVQTFHFSLNHLYFKGQCPIASHSICSLISCFPKVL